MRRILVFGFGIVCAAFGAAACTSLPEAQVCTEWGIVCPAGMRCAAKQAACIEDDCGNGVLEGDEECDDGNISEQDGCSPRCRLESCGNGIKDPDEECDYMAPPSEGKTCSRDCKFLQCGNGIKDPTEACDDGN